MTELLVFAIASWITGLLSLGLGLVAFIKKRDTDAAHAFLGITLAIAIWSISLGLEVVSKDASLAVFFSKIMHFGVILIGPAYLRFSLILARIRKPKLLLFSYFCTAPLVLANFFDQIVRSVSPKSYFLNYTDPGPVYPILLLYFYAMSIAGSTFLVMGYKKTQDTNTRNQIIYVLLASLFGFFGGSLTYLPVFGIDINCFSMLLVSVYTLMLSYAIVRHQLLDIEIIIKRTAVFAGLFAFVYGSFTLVSIFGKEILRHGFGWNEWAAMVPTVFIVTTALRPLEEFLTTITERFLFQKKYDYRDLLKTFTDEILTVLELQKLTEQTVAGLVKIMKLEAACVLLHDKENKRYQVVAGFGMREKDISISEQDTLIRYLKAIHHPILKEKDVDRIHGDGHLKDDFKKLNAQLCLPISLHDDLVGVLALGMKKSGEDYTQEDIDILFTLSRTEAIAISNARLFDELSKTQAEAAQREKMAVIGTLAAGINHEICNPLGIVRGHCEMFLLNSRDGFYDAISRDELLKLSTEIMNKVIRETDRATAITKKLSSFAKPSRKVDTEEVHIEKEVEEVLDLVAHDLKFSNIDVQIQFPQDFPSFRADRKQIQEVLFNIIRNAAQAIDKKEGRIVLSGLTENGSVLLRISDNGAGIPAEKLSQIFSPFFTTKAPGEGTGLGLFIVKQIVERNKGAIQVESEAGIGTTFTLRFPLPQAELVH